MKVIIGKIAPISIPALKASCSPVSEKASESLAANGNFNTKSVTAPTSHGPDEHPASPPPDRSANIIVPPSGKYSAVIVSVQGQSRLTQKPQRAQNARLTMGLLEIATAI